MQQGLKPTPDTERHRTSRQSVLQLRLEQRALLRTCHILTGLLHEHFPGLEEVHKKTSKNKSHRRLHRKGKELAKIQIPPNPNNVHEAPRSRCSVLTDADPASPRHPDEASPKIAPAPPDAYEHLLAPEEAAPPQPPDTSDHTIDIARSDATVYVNLALGDAASEVETYDNHLEAVYATGWDLETMSAARSRPRPCSHPKAARQSLPTTTEKPSKQCGAAVGPPEGMSPPTTPVRGHQQREESITPCHRPPPGQPMRTRGESETLVTQKQNLRWADIMENELLLVAAELPRPPEGGDSLGVPWRIA